MDIKVSEDKCSSIWVDRENIIYCSEIEPKTVDNDEDPKVIQQRNESKTLSEVTLVENMPKNPQSFLEINLAQEEVLLSYKLQDHAYD